MNPRRIMAAFPPAARTRQLSPTGGSSFHAVAFRHVRALLPTANHLAFRAKQAAAVVWGQVFL